METTMERCMCDVLKWRKLVLLGGCPHIVTTMTTLSLTFSLWAVVTSDHIVLKRDTAMPTVNTVGTIHHVRCCYSHQIKTSSLSLSHYHYHTHRRTHSLTLCLSFFFFFLCFITNKRFFFLNFNSISTAPPKRESKPLGSSMLRSDACHHSNSRITSSSWKESL